MKEDEVRIIAKLLERKKTLREEHFKVATEATKPSYQSQPVLEIGKSGLFSNCPVNIYTFVGYLKSEMNSLNEQLKELGVDIEGEKRNA